MNKTPITIFSGYLGSGKTTIILNALKQYKDPVHFAMIKNEYGDASVDGALAKQSNVAVKEIVNGCLCCILVGSLNEAINQLIAEQHPERIIIEASGDALPFPIVLELKKNDQVYVDGVISVVDCENFETVKDTSIVARKQAESTDLIIFNKTQLVDEDKLYHVKEEIFGINPDTPKIDTSDGIIDPHVLFGIPDAHQKWEHLHDEVEEHHHHDNQTFVFITDKPFDLDKLSQVLNACEPSCFYRIKGIIKDQNQTWQLINKVFKRLDIKHLDQFDSDQSRLIFIGKNIQELQPMIQDYLEKALIVT